MSALPAAGLAVPGMHSRRPGLEELRGLCAASQPAQSCLFFSDTEPHWHS